MFLSWIFALLTAAPAASVTLPAIVAENVCPKQKTELTTTETRNTESRPRATRAEGTHGYRLE
jgi:hypothetical protein